MQRLTKPVTATADAVHIGGVIFQEESVDSERYMNAMALEHQGSIAAAGKVLMALAEEQHPLAPIELGFRYSVEASEHPELFCPGKDLGKSKPFVEAGKQGLLRLAQEGDGEAMRMLGYLYLNHLGPYGVSAAEAEAWLRKAFEAGCHFAANDLFTFYLGRDEEEARRWYAEAEGYRCRVVFHQDFET